MVRTPCYVLSANAPKEMKTTEKEKQRCGVLLYQCNKTAAVDCERRTWHTEWLIVLYVQLVNA